MPVSNQTIQYLSNHGMTAVASEVEEIAHELLECRGRGRELQAKVDADTKMLTAIHEILGVSMASSRPIACYVNDLKTENASFRARAEKAEANAQRLYEALKSAMPHEEMK